MKKSGSGRRHFLRNAAAAMAGMAAFPEISRAGIKTYKVKRVSEIKYDKPRIRFSVIGINHGHINSQVDAVKKGGGEFVSFYAKEPQLAQDFAKKYPGVKQVASMNEIFDDNTIQLVVSAAIPDERASIGIEVMKRGKDFMADKPGIVTMKQLEDVKRVQKETCELITSTFSLPVKNRN